MNGVGLATRNTRPSPLGTRVKDNLVATPSELIGIPAGR
ncbi:hypothetical protein YPPY02_1977 [Yersinia pestis PY-02]|nr:hypothetical protein YPPY02_1977 [Yersinia pestis PY-02]